MQFLINNWLAGYSSRVKQEIIKMHRYQTVQLQLPGCFRFPHVLSECEKKKTETKTTAAGVFCPDLVVHGTQQLSKPVEGLKLPADPHKIKPSQPEARPAVTVQGAER